MSEVLVQVEGVSKKYCRDLKTSLWYGVKDIGRELTGRRLSQNLRKKEFWAVDDVTFQLRRGEALGIIGHNGAGKSTLLKMLCGIIKPNKGRICMRGGVQALIELGAGFNPILTGRENIFIAAAIMGIPRAQVRKRFDQIVAFSELEDFIDTPLQSYSSGMKVRLGFAVAVNVEPDVLIIDEVLAVGDAKFRRKARNTMQELLDRDVALIFISHNIHEVLGITQTVLWMDHGRTLKTGPSNEVCAEYTMRANAASWSLEEDDRFQYLPKNAHAISVDKITFGPENKPPIRVLKCEDHQPATLSMYFTSNEDINERVFHALTVIDHFGSPVAYTMLDDLLNLRRGDRLHKQFEINHSNLHPGNYRLVYELCSEGGPFLQGMANAAYLEILRQAKGAFGANHNKRMIDAGRGAILLDARLKVPIVVGCTR